MLDRLKKDDFWVLENKIITSKQGILITQPDIDELEEMESYIHLYVWGAKLRGAVRHTFTNPKDFLASLVEDVYTLENAEDLVSDGYMEAPINMKGTYCVEINKGTIEERTIYGITPEEALLNGVREMFNKNLIKIISEQTEYEVIPVYCCGNNPNILTLTEDKDTRQIGYMLIDSVQLVTDSFYDEPKEAAEDYLLLVMDANSYGYRYFTYDYSIGKWIEKEMYFTYAGDEEKYPFIGDNPMTNGFFDGDYMGIGKGFKNAVLGVFDPVNTIVLEEYEDEDDIEDEFLDELDEDEEWLSDYDDEEIILEEDFV